MVCTSLSPTRRKENPELENSPNKRKWEEAQIEGESEKIIMKAKSMKSIFHTQIHLGTQLPLDWQPCLKSGQVQYYNTKTQKSTLNDPKMSQEEPPSSPGHMNLELELNQPCGSMSRNNHNHDNFMINHYSSSSSNISTNQFPNNSEGLTRCPLWLASEGDQIEMVTAVCKKCHMLVMMYKSSPACPKRKFMHSLGQSPPIYYSTKLLGSRVRS